MNEEAFHETDRRARWMEQYLSLIGAPQQMSRIVSGVGISEGAGGKVQFAEEYRHKSGEVDVVHVQVIDAFQLLQRRLGHRHQSVESSLQAGHQHPCRNSVAAY